MTWLQTYTGKVFDPINTTEDMIDIVDIAHALSMQCRYSGHTKKFYSVAEHSIIVSRNVHVQNAVAALLHDASEAYLVDIPKPLKPLIPEYSIIEDNLMRIISRKFGFIYPLHKEIKEIDRRMLLTERAQLMTKPTKSWDEGMYGMDTIENLRPIDWKISALDHNAAESMFLMLARELGINER